jgi:hypothetical protein
MPRTPRPQRRGQADRLLDGFHQAMSLSRPSLRVRWRSLRAISRTSSSECHQYQSRTSRMSTLTSGGVAPTITQPAAQVRRVATTVGRSVDPELPNAPSCKNDEITSMNKLNRRAPIYGGSTHEVRSRCHIQLLPLAMCTETPVKKITGSVQCRIILALMGLLHCLCTATVRSRSQEHPSIP